MRDLWFERPPFKTVAAVFLCVLALALAIPLMVPTPFALDSAAFYCAARAVLAQQNPYHVGPLSACEHAVSSAPFFVPGLVLPAPLPPYAIALISPLGIMSFAAAQHVIHALNAGGYILAVVLLARMVPVRWQIIALAIAPFSWTILLQGQTILALLGVLIATAFLLLHERYVPAAICAALLMIEPHLGLPVCAALVLYRPKLRIPLLFAGASLAALAFAVMPEATIVEYFRSVLPLHALSEIHAGGQMSLAVLLATVGISPETAIVIASAQYAATLCFALWICRRSGDAAVVFVPAAFALIGGTFVHFDDFVLAVPAAMMLGATAPVIFSLVLFSPHNNLVGGAIADWVCDLSLGALVAYAGWFRIGLFLSIALIVANVPQSHPFVDTPMIDVSPSTIAEVVWAHYVPLLQPMSPALFAEKIVMYIGLLTLAMSLVGALRGNAAISEQRKATQVP